MVPLVFAEIHNYTNEEWVGKFVEYTRKNRLVSIPSMVTPIYSPDNTMKMQIG